MKVICKCNV